MVRNFVLRVIEKHNRDDAPTMLFRSGDNPSIDFTYFPKLKVVCVQYTCLLLYPLDEIPYEIL